MGIKRAEILKCTVKSCNAVIDVVEPCTCETECGFSCRQRDGKAHAQNSRLQNRKACAGC